MCRGCTGINIGEVLFQIVGEHGHAFGYLGRFDSGHIVHFLYYCATQGCTSEIIIIFVYILIRWEGVIWI